MPISINPILPVIAAQGAAPELVLQPGTVVDARVLKVLSENLVRIAIASLSIDVLSEVPLQAGQNLQLAVSQTQTASGSPWSAGRAPVPRFRIPSPWRRTRLPMPRPILPVAATPPKNI